MLTFTSAEDVIRRVPLHFFESMITLAEAGAFGAFIPEGRRRQYGESFI